MADSKDGGQGLSPNVILVLVAIATGGGFFGHKLLSLETRPPSAERQIHSTSGGSQGVNARLWQDPIAVVRNAWAEEKGDPRVRSCDDHPPPHTCPPNLKEKRVIGVLVPGQPYAEDAESRRRYRYAVLGALGVHDYAPDDDVHIGYFVPKTSVQVPLPRTIPFEVFESARNDQRPQIVVFWINEDALSRASHPIASLRRLSTELNSKGLNTWRGPMQIIGPNASYTLKAMLDEAPPKEPVELGECPHIEFELFNYGATADDQSLGVTKESPLEARLRCRGIAFHRIIASDQALAKGLAHELIERRGLCLTSGKPCGGIPWLNLPGRVAIVSEWDTFYGRSLPDTICHALSDSDCQSNAFERFSYLRGLDGQLPSDGPSANAVAAPAESASLTQERDQQKTKSDDSSDDAAKRLEHPDGLGQVDYLRRLADRMKHRDRELRRQGEAGITAIGVLGDDVFDKLLVLRVLRPEFPGALFFTTDLDARLADADEIPATRNLLVVSSFGLQLRRKLQREIPPFRDGYQTAVFASMQAALRLDACSIYEQPRHEQPSLAEAAHLFEVGRTAIFAFPDAPALAPSLLQESDGLYPKLMPQPWALSAAGLLSGLLLAGLSIACLALAGGFGSRPTAGLAALAFIVGALGCVFWNCMANDLTLHGNGEPILLAEGISIWPAIVLRLAGSWLSITLIFYTKRQLDGNIDEIAAALKLDSRSNVLKRRSKEHGSREGHARFRRWRLSRLDNFFFDPHLRRSLGRGHPYLISDFWDTYVGASCDSSRPARVILCVIAVTLISIALTAVFGVPNIPARDSFTGGIYVAATFFEFVTTQSLIFVVADATFFSSQFVRKLRNFDSVWPEESRKEFRALCEIEAPRPYDRGRSEPIDEWLDTQFVGKRTTCIINLIYLPFAMIALLRS